MDVLIAFLQKASATIDAPTTIGEFEGSLRVAEWFGLRGLSRRFAEILKDKWLHRDPIAVYYLACQFNLSDSLVKMAARGCIEKQEEEFEKLISGDNARLRAWEEHIERLKCMRLMVYSRVRQITGDRYLEAIKTYCHCDAKKGKAIHGGGVPVWFSEVVMTVALQGGGKEAPAHYSGKMKKCRAFQGCLDLVTEEKWWDKFKILFDSAIREVVDASVPPRK